MREVAEVRGDPPLRQTPDKGRRLRRLSVGRHYGVVPVGTFGMSYIRCPVRDGTHRYGYRYAHHKHSELLCVVLD